MIEKYIIGKKACYALASRFITVRGIDYEVVSSTSTNNIRHSESTDVTHTLKNIATGERIEVKMMDILKRFEKDYPEKIVLKTWRQN